MLSCRTSLRAPDTKPRAYTSWLSGKNLLTPLGCTKGHLTYFQLGNSNTFHVRAQQFSSCKSITISGQKVKINILKWVSLSFISICCKHNHRRMSENLYDDILGRFLVIPRLCKWQPSENESKTQHACLRAGLAAGTALGAAEAWEEASETPLRPRHPPHVPCPGRIWHRTTPTAWCLGKALTTASPGHPERPRSESCTPKTSPGTPDGGSRERAEAWGGHQTTCQGESAAPGSATGQHFSKACHSHQLRLEQLAHGRSSSR